MSACFPCSALPGYIHSFYRWILSCFYELPFLFIRLGFCSFMLVWLCVRTFWEPMGAISVLGTLNPIPSYLSLLVMLLWVSVCYVSVLTFKFMFGCIFIGLLLPFVSRVHFSFPIFHFGDLPFVRFCMLLSLRVCLSAFSLMAAHEKLLLPLRV